MVGPVRGLMGGGAARRVADNVLEGPELWRRTASAFLVCSPSFWRKCLDVRAWGGCRVRVTKEVCRDLSYSLPQASRRADRWPFLYPWKNPHHASAPVMLALALPVGQLRRL